MQTKNYRIYVKHKREITKWNDMKIDIYIKLNQEEFDLMKMQQVQVNESIMIKTWWAKTVSYTHMIEHVITPTKAEFTDKIQVNSKDEWDKEILGTYMKQLLNMTEEHILKSKALK